MNAKIMSMAYKFVMSDPLMAEKFLQTVVFGKRGKKVKRKRRTKAEMAEVKK